MKRFSVILLAAILPLAAYSQTPTQDKVNEQAKGSPFNSKNTEKIRDTQKEMDKALKDDERSRAKDKNDKPKSK